MTAKYDVTGIGNAIVDVIAHADDSFLAREGLDKGAMRLIDANRAQELYSRMAPGIEMSGGSAGNTMAGIASLGGVGAYIGKVGADQLGDVFRHDMRAGGTRFDTEPVSGGAPTARCLILVTPDAQRTMNTFLGACVELGPEDIDDALISDSRVTYLEGYLFDPPRAKQAFVKAATIAHAAGREVALSLSDAFCVHRHQESFRHLVDHHVDVLFANEHEITALYGVQTFHEAVQAVRGRVKVAVLTQSSKGSTVATADNIYEVGVESVAKVVDTTGAGDLYAAGFLSGYTRGRELPICGRLGAIAAAEVIGHFGARPEVSLADLVAARL